MIDLNSTLCDGAVLGDSRHAQTTLPMSGGGPMEIRHAHIDHEIDVGGPLESLGDARMRYDIRTLLTIW